MKFKMAFKSGELDRAAHQRMSDVARDDEGSGTLLFWRGKLLLTGAGRPAIVPLGHSALADARDAPVFLGLTPEGPRFASDLSLWSPPEDATTIGQFIDQSLQVHPAFPEAKFVEIRGIMPSLSLIDAECVGTGKALVGWHAAHRFCSNCGSQSAIENAGWVRKCPQCGTQHFPRTDPVVIMVITRGDKLLLGRAPSWPERMYSLLAGFVEPGETIESAVRREVFEESAVRVGGVRYVASQPWPFPMSLMFGCHGEASTDDIRIDPTELADARWVDRAQVQAILRGSDPDISPPRPGAIAGALIEAWADERLLDPDYWRH